METISIREQPDGLLTVQQGKFHAFSLDEWEVLSLVEQALLGDTPLHQPWTKDPRKQGDAVFTQSDTTLNEESKKWIRNAT